MFERTGKLIERRWKAVLIVWGLALAAALGVHHQWFDAWLPVKVLPWKQVAKDGEFSFLPPDMQSLVGERLLAKAFPKDILKSFVVVVAWRYQALQPEDMDFIEEVLKPRLEALREDPKLNLDPDMQIMTWKDRRLGRLLVSDDGQSTLVIMPLQSEFLEWSNLPIIERVERLLENELVDDSKAGK